MGEVTGIQVQFRVTRKHVGTSDDLYVGIVTQKTGGFEWNLSTTRSGDKYEAGKTHDRRIGRWKTHLPYRPMVYRPDLPFAIDEYFEKQNAQVYLRKKDGGTRSEDDALGIDSIKVMLEMNGDFQTGGFGGTGQATYALETNEPILLGVEKSLIVWVPYQSYNSSTFG